VHDVFTGFGMGFGCKIVGLLVRHVASIAIGLGFLGIVETASTVPCNTA